MWKTANWTCSLQLLDKDDLSETESGQGAIAPYNSMLYLQDTAQQDRYGQSVTVTFNASDKGYSR